MTDVDPRAATWPTWPLPTIPPNNRTNASPRDNNHPTDHNQIADALTSIAAQLQAFGYAPRQGSVASPWLINGSLIFPGSTGLTWLVWARIANVVHVTTGLYIQSGNNVPGADGQLVQLKLPWPPDPNIYKVTGDAAQVAGRAGMMQYQAVYPGFVLVNLNQTTPTNIVGMFVSANNGPWAAFLRQSVNAVGAVVAGTFHYVTASTAEPVP